MKNPKFVRLSFDAQSLDGLNFQLLDEISELLYLYRHKLFDGFTLLNPLNKRQFTLELVRKHQPFFWAILDPDSGALAGVVYLYDHVGNHNSHFSSKISTCFHRKFWGKFAHRAGKLFLRFAWRRLKIFKLSAEIFDSNLLAQKFVYSLGFRFASRSIASSADASCKLQNLLCYSVFNNS